MLRTCAVSDQASLYGVAATPEQNGHQQWQPDSNCGFQRLHHLLHPSFATSLHAKLEGLHALCLCLQPSRDCKPAARLLTVLQSFVLHKYKQGAGSMTLAQGLPKARYSNSH